MKNLMTALVLCSISFAAAAVEKRYVTDTLFLQLRSGPSTEYRILKALRSGEHLILVEEEEEGEALENTTYTKVRTDKGLEGYVLTRFLVDEPIAKEKLILAERELSKIKAELETTRQQNKEIQAELRNTKSERSGLDKENSDLESELEQIKRISASALALNERNKELTKSNSELNIQLESLTTENTQLHDTRQQSYLLYGGGLVVIGILAGLILPSLRAKRSGSSWS